MLLQGVLDRTGYFEIAAAYAEPDGFLKEYSYRVEIHIKTEEVIGDPRGGWNGVLALAGETRAFTEYPESERSGVWSKNFEEIADFLATR